MGMDPRAEIFYGVGGYDLELPEAARSRAESDFWSRENLTVRFDIFHTNERTEEIGFGVSLGRWDWNDAPAPLDLTELQAKLAQVKPEVDAFLDEHGVGGERRLYLSCDYS